MTTLYVNAEVESIQAIYVTALSGSAFNIVFDDSKKAPVLEPAGAVGLEAIVQALEASAPSLLGTNDAEKAEVAKWLRLPGADVLPQAEAALRSNGGVWLAGGFGRRPSAADAAALPAGLGALRDWRTPPLRAAHPEVLRWADAAQHAVLPLLPPLPSVLSAWGEFVPLKLQFTPPPKEEKKDQEKKEAQPAQDGGAQKGKGAAAKAKPAAAPKADSPGAKLDLRVGRIVDCKPHPKADKLYVESISFGEAEPRVVVSGLKEFVPIEEMQNRLVVVVTNLKPAPLQDIMSYGLVLCASNDDHTKVEILDVPEDTPVGERVIIEGHEGEAASQIAPKVWHKLKKELKTNDKGVATFGGSAFTTSKGPVTTKTLFNSIPPHQSQS